MRASGSLVLRLISVLRVFPAGVAATGLRMVPRGAAGGRDACGSCRRGLRRAAPEGDFRNAGLGSPYGCFVAHVLHFLYARARTKRRTREKVQALGTYHPCMRAWERRARTTCMQMRMHRP